MPIRKLITAVLALTFARLIINMTRRFPYPFLPEISRQLSVPLASVQGVMAIQSGIGLSSPLFGTLSERFGRKRILLVVLLGMAATCVFGAIWPQFWMFALVMLALGLGKWIYDPAMQAYLGDRIPYKRRGMAIGFTELSWALSLIVVAPLAGFLLETATLQALFAVLAVLLLASMLMIWVFLAADHPQKGTQTRVVSLGESFRIIRHNPAALGGLAFSALLLAANEIMFINYGAWMEGTFRLDPVRLGAVTTVIALAEVAGELSVIGLADKWGKRRMALVGVLVSSVAYAVLPTISADLNLALVNLFLMSVSFEIAVVASISLFTEVMPQARSVMMSGFAGASSLGRLGGAFVGGLLYSMTLSFQVVGLTALIIGLLAAGAMWAYVQENTDTASKLESM